MTTVSDDAFDRMANWWPQRPLFTVNDHGMWCNWCGECIAPSWFFEDEDFAPRESCKGCGMSGVEDDE